MIGRLRRLGRDERGVTVIEFAIVAPVLLLLIMGFSELVYQIYVQSVLTGAVQQAGRDSAIEASDTATIDAKVESMVKTVAADAKFDPKRLNYDNYAAVAPEPFVDKNGNGKYDVGECYQDVNGSKAWEADPGTTGQGDASDVTLYTMNVTYGRLFPVALVGLSSSVQISSQTILKNQPYRTQTTTNVVQRCS